MKVYIDKQVYAKDDFRIFRCHSNEIKSFSIKGDLSYLDVGEEYDLEIELIEENKYGKTFSVLECLTFSNFNPHDLTREEKYNALMMVTKSSKIANNILDVCPDFIGIIVDGDDVDYTNIKGVGARYYSAYKDKILERYRFIGVAAKLKAYKLTFENVKALARVYLSDEDIIKNVKEQPYHCLIDICKFGFMRADKIIIEARPDLRVSPLRCERVICEVLKLNEQYGSTRLNGNTLYDYMAQNMGCPELMPLVVNTVKNSPIIHYDEATTDVSVQHTYDMEMNVANFIKEKLANPHILDVDVEKYREVNGYKLTDKQLSALDIFCRNDVMVLSGFSGAGKTTSINGLIKVMEDEHLSYTLLSPSGKAAQRMYESTHRKASTIHLKCLRDKDINSDVIIIDEFSMCAIDVINMLVNTISNPDCKIIFVGDFAQLAAVGSGRVYYDIIESGAVPMVVLDEVFRYNTDGGLFVATNARNGVSFFKDEMVDREGNEYKVCDNYKFIDTINVKKTLLNEYKGLLEQGIKPSDILCLTPQNVGDLGTYALNNLIQDVVNARTKYITRKIGNIEIKFKVGDLVLNTKNNYTAIVHEDFCGFDDDEEEGEYSKGKKITTVFNGQIGVVREIFGDTLVVEIDNEFIEYDSDARQNLLLAYAMTIHKSQGSESKYVIQVISKEHQHMLSRNLLYVGDTRGKVKTIDIGNIEAYNEALRVEENKKRNTWLKEMLTSD